ncbi:MAG: FliA/WhiG family RNA polymerase sigma factor [Vampirovibrionales bacterium]
MVSTDPSLVADTQDDESLAPAAEDSEVEVAQKPQRAPLVLAPAMDKAMSKPNTPRADVTHHWQAYKADPDNRQLREKLILNYLHLVRYVVSRLPMTLPVSITQDDLVSYGTLGLMEAVERFDLSRGLKFETYAITRIRGAIIDQLRSQDWIPRGVRKRTKLLQEAMVKLQQSLNRPPTEEELATELGVEVPKVRSMLAESNNLMLSLDEHRNSDDESNSLIDTIEDVNSPDPQGELEATELKDRLAKAINALPERERLLIALYYHENMTLREIGQVLSVSESRVCQLHAQAVMRLKNRLAEFK